MNAGPVCRRSIPAVRRFVRHLRHLSTIAGFIAAGLVPAATAAEPPADPLIIAETRVVHSAILGQDRRISVYLPRMGTGSNENGPFPVLYLLDGERQLPLVAGQIDYLSKINLSMPQMIVVGIDTNGYDRLHDLTPTHSDRADPDSPIVTGPSSPTRTSGGGETFLRFLGEELVPYVDRHYRTAPFKVLAGHSLGGLLTVHALLRQPRMFDAYVAISPSLWWDDESLILGAVPYLGSGRLAGKRLFLSISGEGGKFHDGLARFDGLLKAHASSGLAFRYREYSDETHASGPVAAYYDAWKFLFPAWLSPTTDDTPQKTEAFYAEQSRRYGYRIVPPEGIVNGRGYAALRSGRAADALGFFRMNIANYPGSANAFDSLGDAYVQSGPASRAMACYMRALALAPSSEDTRRKLVRLKDSGETADASGCDPEGSGTHGTPAAHVPSRAIRR